MLPKIQVQTLNYKYTKMKLVPEGRLKIQPDILHFQTQSWKGYCCLQLQLFH